MTRAEQLIGVQEPRIWSTPDYVSSSGQEAIELAAMAGLFLDPWQQFILRHALGERADGRWAAKTVGVVVPRQNGKNGILEARELIGLFLLKEQVIIHSAHEQATSSEHFRRLLALIEGVPEFDKRVLKAPKGKGAEAIELRGGQRILFKTRTGGGGRGFSVDCIVYDEAMILSAEAKAALVPTQAARSMEGNTQTWYAGSAVDQQNPKHDGLELARIREEGMKGNESIAYFEHSAEGDDPGDVPEDIAADPDVWATANPGLGIRISAEWVEHERTVELGAREFAVERLGIGDWPEADEDADSVIDLDAWRALKDAGSTIEDGLCFAFDVSPDRSWATISSAGDRGDGTIHTEVVARGRGTRWVAQRAFDLREKWSPVAIVCDGASPAASLLHEFEQLGIDVEVANAKDMANACGMIFDLVQQGADAIGEQVAVGLRHLGTPELESAIRGAKKRPLGDAWAWSRKGSQVDITPLVACTLAVWACQTRDEEIGAVAFDLDEELTKREKAKRR